MSVEKRCVGLGAHFIGPAEWPIPVWLSAAVGVRRGERFAIDSKSSLLVAYQISPPRQLPASVVELFGREPEVFCSAMAYLDAIEAWFASLHGVDIPFVTSDERMYQWSERRGSPIHLLPTVQFPELELLLREAELIGRDSRYAQLGPIAVAVRDSKVDALRYLDRPHIIVRSYTPPPEEETTEER